MTFVSLRFKPKLCLAATLLGLLATPVWASSDAVLDSGTSRIPGNLGLFAILCILAIFLIARARRAQRLAAQKQIAAKSASITHSFDPRSL